MMPFQIITTYDGQRRTGLIVRRGSQFQAQTAEGQQLGLFACHREAAIAIAREDKGRHK